MLRSILCTSHTNCPAPEAELLPPRSGPVVQGTFAEWPVTRVKMHCSNSDNYKVFVVCMWQPSQLREHHQPKKQRPRALRRASIARARSADAADAGAEPDSSARSTAARNVASTPPRSAPSRRSARHRPRVYTVNAHPLYPKSPEKAVAQDILLARRRSEAGPTRSTARSARATQASRAAVSSAQLSR